MPSYQIDSVANAIEVINCLAASQAPLSVTEVAHGTALGRSLVYRVLRTLEESGYVARVKGGYTLGYRFLKSSSASSIITAVRRVCHASIDTLAQDLNATVYIGFRQGRYVIIGDRAASRDAGPQEIKIGGRLPLHATSMGKVFLAHMKPADLWRHLTDSTLEKLATNTITDLSEMLSHLETVRCSNVAASRNEFSNDMASLSMGVRDGDETVFAISVCWQDEKIAITENMIEKVRKSVYEMKVLLRMQES